MRAIGLAFLPRRFASGMGGCRALGRCAPAHPLARAFSLLAPPSAAAPPFSLPDAFLAPYRALKPPFGFNGLGYFVYRTRYARPLPGGGGLESWHDTVARVVHGTFRMQQRWMLSQGLPWDPARAGAEARIMFDKMFHMKFLPPGRGLWAMGSPMTEQRGLFAALNNCGFVSTAGLGEGDPAAPFCWLMDAAMLGVGVGFDTLGAGRVAVAGPAPGGGGAPHRVADSREGWVASLRALLEAHLLGRPLPAFDYSGVRPRGAPIAGFGGVASGPEVLARLHAQVHATLAPLAGKPLTVTALVDVMNQIGRCVVSGEVRQTAEIAFGDPACEEYVALKDYRVNPGRAEWGWTSNNSVFAELGMDYGPLAARVAHNGEPGFAWLEKMRA